MRRAALPFVIALTVVAWATSRAEDPPGIVWRRDLAAARDEARAGGKPLLLVFRCEP